MRHTDTRGTDKPQLDKFKEAARELETDDREEAFDERLKRVAKASADEDRKKRPSKRGAT